MNKLIPKITTSLVIVKVDPLNVGVWHAMLGWGHSDHQNQLHDEAHVYICTLMYVLFVLRYMLELFCSNENHNSHRG